MLAAMEADGSGDGADAVASTTADPGGSELINGRYASRSTWPSPSSSTGSSNGKRNGSGSTDSMDTYDDELDTLRTVLREKEREIAGMRTERALMERELATAAADRERLKVFGADLDGERGGAGDDSHSRRPETPAKQTTVARARRRV